MPPSQSAAVPLDRGAFLLSGIGALLLFIAHAATNRHYGFHGDELYFIDCAKRLDWGYVDHPPLLPWLIRAISLFFGYSLGAIRLIPAVSLSLTLFLVGLLSRRIGGGIYAQVLAMLAFAFAPAFLRGGAFVSLPGLEILLWTVLFWLLIEILEGEKQRLWLAFGLLAGLTLLAKVTVVFVAAGLVLALIVTPARHHLRSKWIYLGGGLAFLVYLPNLLWQAGNGWAMIEFLSNLNSTVMSRIPRSEFLVGQLVYVGPLNTLVWMTGVGYCLLTKQRKALRPLGWVYVFLFLLLLLLKSKVYYLAPVYPVFLAIGAVALEQATTGTKWRALRYAYPAAIVITGLLFVPIAMPVLTLQAKDRYVMGLLGLVLQRPGQLTDDFHAQIAWEAEVGEIAKAYEKLDDEHKAQCAILTARYEQAGAINYFGAAYGLPEAISGRNTYYLWGYQEFTGECVLAFDIPEALLRETFQEVTLAAKVSSKVDSVTSKVRNLFLCRGPVAPMKTLWPKFKRYE